MRRKSKSRGKRSIKNVWIHVGSAGLKSIIKKKASNKLTDHRSCAGLF